MQERKTQGLTTMLVTVLAIMWAALFSCAHHQAPHVLAENRAFGVDADSVWQGSWTARTTADGAIQCNVTAAALQQALPRTGNIHFVQGTAWHPGKHADHWPQFSSQHLPLVDALFGLSADDIINRHAGSGYAQVTDTIALLHAMNLSLAAIEPQRCINVLRSCVGNDSILRLTGGTWPIYTHCLLWAQAAWETYLVTADKQWLRWAHAVLARTLAADEYLLLPNSGLLQGATYSPDERLLYPAWMQPVDKFTCATLAGNIAMARAYVIANEMRAELGLEESQQYADASAHLTAAINQQMWDENRGCFSAMLYGMVHKMASPVADNMAQALAVMWDIANDDRAVTLVEKNPVTNEGINNYYPARTGIEPYFGSPTWPLTQACWNLACAAVDNEYALRSGLAAMMRAQAFFTSQRITLQGQPDNSFLMGAASMAMTLRVMMGIKFVADGIEFSPRVPSCFDGNKTLAGLHYRDAVLNITVHGTGNDVERMEIDGKPVEGNFLHANLTGTHRVDVHVRQGRTSTGRITLARTGTVLPPIPQVVWTPDSGYIEGFQSTGAYTMVRNGVRPYSINDSASALPATGDLAEISLVSANKFGYSHCTPPRLLIKGETHTLGVDDVAGNDTTGQALRLEVSVLQGGNYLIDVNYHATRGCDLRQLLVNTHTAGVLALPRADMPSAFLTSNVLEVELLRGNNVIEIIPLPSLPRTGTAQVQNVRIYKNNQKYRL